MALILVGGGARSGKSRHALALAERHGGRLGFIATAQAFDEEMRERIALHQRDRDPRFETIEAPIDLAGAIAAACQDAIVVDCLTLWLTNVMLGGLDLTAETALFIEAGRRSRSLVIVVTNEVGCGIVPENELARRFRDEAGRLNQRVAEAATEVYWMVFGCPLRVK